MSIKTPEAILSYTDGLFEPSSAAEGADPRYSVTLVFPEGTDLTELKTEAIKAAKEEWGEELAGAERQVLQTQHGPANFLVAGQLRIRLPWRDAPEDVANKGYPEGSTFVNVRSPNPPGVVSNIADPSNNGKPASIVSRAGDVRLKDGTVIPQARPVYSGCIGRGLLSVFAYTVSGNSGVSFGLSGVQVLDDGERLDGRASAEDEFDAEMEAADLSDLTDEEPAGVGAGEDDDLGDLIG